MEEARSARCLFRRWAIGLSPVTQQIEHESTYVVYTSFTIHESNLPVHRRQRLCPTIRLLVVASRFLDFTWRSRDKPECRMLNGTRYHWVDRAPSYRIICCDVITLNETLFFHGQALILERVEGAPRYTSLRIRPVRILMIS